MKPVCARAYRNVNLNFIHEKRKRGGDLASSEISGLPVIFIGFSLILELNTRQRDKLTCHAHARTVQVCHTKRRDSDGENSAPRSERDWALRAPPAAPWTGGGEVSPLEDVPGDDSIPEEDARRIR